MDGKALNNHPELAARMFEALDTVTPGQFISEGRMYGGGLYKVEIHFKSLPDVLDRRSAGSGKDPNI